MSPSATYRVQLHAGFGFEDAAGICDYLAALGVSHLYCSPCFQAAPGSTHGYDVVDPQRLDEERGGAPAYTRLVAALRDAGLGQVLDIVPNHMATAAGNRWWWDVLENGPASPYAAYFDIDWEGHDDRSAFTVLVPVLGDHYGRVLEAGELRLARRGGELVVRYADHELPVSPRTLDELLATAARGAGSPELAELADGFASLPSSRITDRAAVTERHERKLELARQLGRLCEEDQAVAKAVDDQVDEVSADPDRLDRLLRRQNYRLAHWRTASEEADYRRFFSIDSLVGVRVEDEHVFDETHALVLELVRDGTVAGLRIDHVDGLRDPAGYLERLRGATHGAYTVVEKILEPGERLPESWPVAGTTGYDFLARVGDLFVDAANEAAMTGAYTSFSGETGTWADVVLDGKQHVMRHELRTEVDRLTRLLDRVCDGHRRHRDHTRRELRDALRELVASYPVYRTYVRPGEPARPEDRRWVGEAVAAAVARRPDVDAELLRFIGELALGDHEGAAEGELLERLQQLTAPVMAKGVEDTAFYRYHRLVALNEVGGDPGTFGRPPAQFHDDAAAAAALWPHTMLALSTHDTKRSADVRARLVVLSELPGEWQAATQRWAERNEVHRSGAWPDRNAEYLLYQTLVGAWPLDADRAVAFMAKATREAKVHTSWVDPVAEYDDALERFVRAVLGDRAFRADLEGFLAEHHLVERGRAVALAQVALLLTSPGVPDIYQGNELWDLSLVDPDNRRPVDLDLRRRLLAGIANAGAEEARAALRDRDDPGVAKLWLVHRLLAHRRHHPETFASGRYEPLELHGAGADAALAFSRGDLVVATSCRTTASLAATSLRLPPGHWRDVLTGTPVDGGAPPLERLFAAFPFAVLAREGA